jgi:hypothetical protein
MVPRARGSSPDTRAGHAAGRRDDRQRRVRLGRLGGLARAPQYRSESHRGSRSPTSGCASGLRSAPGHRCPSRGAAHGSPQGDTRAVARRLASISPARGADVRDPTGPGLVEPAEPRGCGRQARHRTVDCVVVGVAGDTRTPKLVLALRQRDGNLHHFEGTRPLSGDLSAPVAELLGDAGTDEPAIRSRWQHDAIPPWRRVPPRLLCEVRVPNLDAGRWARFPAGFVRLRRDRSPDDCELDQLAL